MAKAPVPAIPVPYATLRGLLGKPVDDPAVAKMIAKAGKVKTDADYIVAKEAGFDYALDRATGAKRTAKKLLSTLFLYPEGASKHRGYAGLPSPFAFGAPRKALLAALPPPAYSWKIGPGKVPVATAGVSHDSWKLDGVDVCAHYRDEACSSIQVSVPDDAMGGRSLSTHPLHFETRPPDAPADAELVGMALLVAWAIDRFGPAPKHAGTPLAAQLAARKITPRAFLVGACGKTLTSLDFDAERADFLYNYTHNLNKPHGKDRRYFVDDFLATFAGVVDNPFHVPDSWEAVDRLGAILDARFADFQATGLAKPPKAGLYEAARKRRDTFAVTATRAPVAAATADAALADDLVALIDRPLADPDVKAVLARAGLPVGKKIDKQANPALGVAYMGTKLDLGGKSQLGIDAVWFFAARRTAFVRGIGAEVQFMAYPGPLPRGLAFGMSRAAAAKLLGKPASEDDEDARWKLRGGKTLRATFARDKLVELRFGQ